MLKKLFGVKSFIVSIDHLARHQAIFHVSLGRLGFPFAVRIVALALLECWALINLTLIIRFQQNDHPIFLDAITHIENNTSLFQMTL
jgi:hypothetical protein